MCLCSVTDLRKSMPILDIVAGEAQERSWVSKTKLTLEPNWILSPLGMVRRWLSSKVACMQMTCTTQYQHTHTCVFKTACIHTIPSLHLSHMYSVQSPVLSTHYPFPLPSTELSDSIHSGSMSPSHMIHEVTSRGSLTTWRALKVRTPSVHSRVSRSMWPKSFGGEKIAKKANESVKQN